LIPFTDRGLFPKHSFALPGCAPTILLGDPWPRSSSHWRPGLRYLGPIHWWGLFYCKGWRTKLGGPTRYGWHPIKIFRCAGARLDGVAPTPETGARLSGHARVPQAYAYYHTLRREDIYRGYKRIVGSRPLPSTRAKVGAIACPGAVQRASNPAIVTFVDGENIVSPPQNRHVYDGLVTLN
jgi:hypothetical protein